MDYQRLLHQFRELLLLPCRSHQIPAAQQGSHQRFKEEDNNSKSLNSRKEYSKVRILLSKLRWCNNHWDNNYHLHSQIFYLLEIRRIIFPHKSPIWRSTLVVVEIYLQDSPTYLLHSVKFKETTNRLLLRIVLWINRQFSKLELAASQLEWIPSQVWYLVLSNKRDSAVFLIISPIPATTIKR